MNRASKRDSAWQRFQRDMADARAGFVGMTDAEIQALVDEAFADNYAEREQAKALRDQARAGDLRFEAYLPGELGDWLSERIEQGHFVDPSEAVFAIVRDLSTWSRTVTCARAVAADITGGG